MKCIICGKEIDKSSYSNAVLCSSECYSENFWNETLADKSRLIIDQDVYWIGPEKKPSPIEFRGFGGKEFYIRMIKNTPDYPAGTVLKSTNLWSNGKIPNNRYNPDMDNAVFITRDEYESLIN